MVVIRALSTRTIEAIERYIDLVVAEGSIPGWISLQSHGGLLALEQSTGTWRMTAPGCVDRHRKCRDQMARVLGTNGDPATSKVELRLSHSALTVIISSRCSLLTISRLSTGGCTSAAAPSGGWKEGAWAHQRPGLTVTGCRRVLLLRDFGVWT